MNPRTFALLAAIAEMALASTLSGGSGPHVGRGCCKSVEFIRKGVAKRRAAKAAKKARKRNRP